MSDPRCTVRSVTNSHKTVFLVEAQAYEPLLHAALLAVTASADGDEVHAMFFFGALSALARGRLDAATPRDAQVPARRRALNLPSIDDLFAQARQLGARLYACDTHLRLAAVDATELTGRIDEVISLPTFWKLTREARVIAI